MDYRTPLKRAQGLGASHHGVGHWWMQRLSAVAMVPLMLWLVVGLATHTGGGYEGAVAWLGNPINTVVLVIACYMAFSAGASNVANAVAPLVGGGAIGVDSAVILGTVASADRRLSRLADDPNAGNERWWTTRYDRSVLEYRAAEAESEAIPTVLARIEGR